MTLENSCPTIAVEPEVVSDLCQYRSATGRHCRQSIFDRDLGLCSDHAARRRKQLEQADLSALLIGDTKEFHSALDINRTLGELLKLEASNKITPRRAAVMAYTCNLLLRTLPVLEHEANSQPQEIIWDLPRPDRDAAHDPQRIIIDMPGPDRD